MPTLAAIAAFHDMPVDRCWTCTAKTKYLERAHIIDRAHHGLDGVQNLAIACVLCNRYGPVFTPDLEDYALAWYGLPGRRSMLNHEDAKFFQPYIERILEVVGA